MKPQAPEALGARTPQPVTVYVSNGQLLGEVVRSHDPRLPLGTPVGLRLADLEGILEPSATVQGVLLQIMVLSHERLPDLSSEVTFELLGAPPDADGGQEANGA